MLCSKGNTEFILLLNSDNHVSTGSSLLLAMDRTKLGHG